MVFSRYNHKHYRDETAKKALDNVEKKEKRTKRKKSNQIADLIPPKVIEDVKKTFCREEKNV